MKRLSYLFGLFILLAFISLLSISCNLNGDDSDDETNDTNDAPVANISVDNERPFLGDTIQFNGGQSSDPENDPLQYTWSLSASPESSLLTITDPSLSVISITPDKSGLYTINITVDDGNTDESRDNSQATVSYNLHVCKAEMLFTNNGNSYIATLQFCDETWNDIIQNNQNTYIYIDIIMWTNTWHHAGLGWLWYEHPTTSADDEQLYPGVSPSDLDRIFVLGTVTEEDMAEVGQVDSMMAYKGVEPLEITYFYGAIPNRENDSIRIIIIE